MIVSVAPIRIHAVFDTMLSAPKSRKSRSATAVTALPEKGLNTIVGASALSTENNENNGDSISQTISTAPLENSIETEHITRRRVGKRPKQHSAPSLAPFIKLVSKSFFDAMSKRENISNKIGITIFDKYKRIPITHRQSLENILQTITAKTLIIHEHSQIHGTISKGFIEPYFVRMAIRVDGIS